MLGGTSARKPTESLSGLSVARGVALEEVEFLVSAAMNKESGGMTSFQNDHVHDCFRFA